MITINLGVMDEDYSIINKPDVTTGEVAVKLEEQYGVMGGFADMMNANIASTVADHLFNGTWDNKAQETLLQLLRIEFQVYIYHEEAVTWGKQGSGIPTEAALMGWSSLLGEATGVRRPSFEDTRTYEDAFTAWIE